MLPSDTQSFELLVSKPRLDSYRNYFKTVTPLETIGFYMWNCDLSINLNVLLGYLEIALRNNTHRSLSNFTSKGSTNSSHWYDSSRINLSADNQRKIDDTRKDKKTGQPLKPAPNPDEIISRLSFGFWPNLLNQLDRRYTDITLTAIFPNHQYSANPSNWKVGANVKSAIAELFEINKLRNRVAHHESVWKFGSIINTSVQPNIIVEPASSNLNESIHRFNRFLTQYDNVLQSLNLDLHNDLFNSSWRKRIEYLISPKGIQRYQTAKNRIAPVAITSTHFHDNFIAFAQDNQPIVIHQNGESGLFHPL